MDEQREKDIQEVCKQAVNATPNVSYQSNGDWSSCPFCGVTVHWEIEDLKELTHESDCAYLIAKDLLTK